MGKSPRQWPKDPPGSGSLMAASRRIPSRETQEGINKRDVDAISVSILFAELRTNTAKWPTVDRLRNRTRTTCSGAKREPTKWETNSTKLIDIWDWKLVIFWNGFLVRWRLENRLPGWRNSAILSGFVHFRPFRLFHDDIASVLVR